MKVFSTLSVIMAALFGTLTAATPAVTTRPAVTLKPVPVTIKPAVVQAPGTIVFCGSQPYRKTDYRCYPQNANLLCPILQGVVYKPCGSGATGACYDPDAGNYGCANGKLYLLRECAGIIFDTNSYVCVGGRYLCPKTHPLRCSDACYNFSQYYCVNGVLKQQGQK